MQKVFISPLKYVQGEGVLTNELRHLEKLGNHFLLLCDTFVYELVGEKLQADLTKKGRQVTPVAFNGETSMNEIKRVSEIARQNQVAVIIGLGGGKTIDAAKAIGDTLSLPVAILPTVASTDAPTSAISVIYTEEGLFDRYVFYKQNPALVLVDTGIIAKAPARLLAAGIGDALATWVEVRAIVKSNRETLAGGQPTLAAQAIAQKCEEVLFANAEQAMLDCEKNQVTPALEAVVEANTLLSGLGFESGGLAIAHAIHNGFTAIPGPIHTLSHGEKVAYGILAQLMLEGAPIEELNRYVTLYRKIGLPTTLEDLNLTDVTYANLLKVGELATKENETSQRVDFAVDAKKVTEALFAVDAYVRREFE